MGAWDFVWMLSKKSLTGAVIGLTISDRYASILRIKGASMQPTLNPGPRNQFGSLNGDFVLLEKFCLENYKFSHGDVVVFRSPYDRNECIVKRLIALQGDWVSIPGTHDVEQVPQGHCWVEGDNEVPGFDSRIFGPIPLGLITGRVTHIIWPPNRVGAVEKQFPKERVSF
uniref:Mitochondrial inner membrane protease subunit 2 n=1 Tax=Wollemia nobilis TaxID=56998 RepID=A0A0C9QNG5_9CONI